jgi:hypothetical protein
MPVATAVGTATVAVQRHPQHGADEEESVDPQAVCPGQATHGRVVAGGQPGERLAAADDVPTAPVGAGAATVVPVVMAAMVMPVRAVAVLGMPHPRHPEAGSDDEHAVGRAMIQPGQPAQRDVVASGDAAQRLAGADDVHDQLPALPPMVMAVVMPVVAVSAMVVDAAGHPQDGSDAQDAVGLDVVHPRQPAERGVVAARDAGQRVAAAHRVVRRGGRRRYQRQDGDADGKPNGVPAHGDIPSCSGVGGGGFALVGRDPANPVQAPSARRPGAVRPGR